MFQTLTNNFLGNSPSWYKKTILFFLILNPILVFLPQFGPVFTGWLLIAEFIFTLAMALKCYPLLPGGLLAIEAIVLGMASTEAVYEEVAANLPVILLLMFMVAGIHFMRDLLLRTFTKLLLGVKSKILLALMFSITAAVLSAFLDALTVTAVIITVAVGFYNVYHKAASDVQIDDINHDGSDDRHIRKNLLEDLEQFRAFLRSLLMHAAVGTALGGVTTLVGEPQNLIVGHEAGWSFTEFFIEMMPVTMPVLFSGLVLVVILEYFKLFGYGATMPASVRTVLAEFDENESKKQTKSDTLKLIVQGLVAVFLATALMLHLAEVGLIGLTVIILLTSFNGIIEEHQIGKAFQEALPFTALLVVFFSIVAIIHHQELFTPFLHAVLNMPPEKQSGTMFLANGLLSAISDNVFVATIYISELKEALLQGAITKDHFDVLAVAVNTGTNLPSVATPNGQAAFLFLLTSAIAPLVRLSYGRMVWMALPYTIVMSGVGYFAATHWVTPLASHIVG